ncbi:MAG TPA: gamma-glutamyl-gamma-aminobutyrate hydrolase family protein [Thermomicrobiales bacterium]
MTRKPIIGITPTGTRDTFPHGTFDRYALAVNYVEAVQAAGGIPIILPPQDDHLALLDHIDGLLLSGGADLDPSTYGDCTVHPETYGIDSRRDRFELALVREAIARGLPLLCICRGIQVLNVALGGTLYQHVPDEHPGALNHRQHENGIAASEPGHVIHAEPGSLLAAVYGMSSIQVNSFHHQAIKEPSGDLRVDGRADDGLIEAVSLADRESVLGVQWHPEMMFRAHTEHLRPFLWLVQTAAVRSLTLAQ